jgi:hypothetical protein
VFDDGHLTDIPAVDSVYHSGVGSLMLLVDTPSNGIIMCSTCMPGW